MSGSQPEDTGSSPVGGIRSTSTIFAAFAPGQPLISDLLRPSTGHGVSRVPWVGDLPERGEKSYWTKGQWAVFQ